MKYYTMCLIVVVCICAGCTLQQVALTASDAQNSTDDSLKKVEDSKSPIKEVSVVEELTDLREAVKPDFHLNGGEIFVYEPADARSPFKVVQAQFAKEEDDTIGMIYISRVEDWRTDTCFVVVSKYAYCDNELLRAGDYMYIGTDQYETYSKYKRTLRVFVDLDGVPITNQEEDERQ